MSEWVLEVSEVNEYVRQLLQNEPALRKVRLRGEISNFKRHSSGHWYFTLKDERCRIAAVMFRQNAMRMSIRPMDGMSVIVSGQVGLYSEGGSYQITCDSMRPDGIGTLYQQFEATSKPLPASDRHSAAAETAPKQSNPVWQSVPATGFYQFPRHLPRHFCIREPSLPQKRCGAAPVS